MSGIISRKDIESTDLPELCDIERVLWMLPDRMCKAEVAMSNAEENKYVQDKLVKEVWATIITEHSDMPVSRAEAIAYSHPKYKQQVLIAGNAIKLYGTAKAEFNALKFMYSSAESLKTLYQSKMKIK